MVKSCVCSLGWAGHGDAEGLIEGGELVGPEKLGVGIDALIKTVHPLRFDCLHGVVGGHWGSGSKNCCSRASKKDTNNLWFFFNFFFEVQNIQDSQWAILLVLSKWVSVLQHGLPYSDWLQNQLWIATVITALLYFKRLKRQFSEDGRTLIRSGMENKDVKSNKPPLGRLKRSDSEEIPSSEATGRYIKVPSDHHIV